MQEVIRSSRAPEFDGRSFTIDYLPASQEGFEIVTKESLLRHPPNTPLQEAERIKVERDRESKARRIGAGFKPLVGLRDIEVDGNTLKLDIKPVTFPTYKVISSPKENLFSLDVSTPTGTALTLLTSEQDGSSKLIVQHRDPKKNFFYADIPGASVAGMLDGELDRGRENRGRLVPITTETIKSNIRKEAAEEIGIESEDLVDIKVTGLAMDLMRIHNEFLLFAKTSLTAQQLGEKAKENAERKKENDFDFHEKFYVIDGTPEAIETLLTKVKCPLPPTHTATFVAGGYSMVLKRDGEEKAREWKSRLQKGIQENYAEMDRMVGMYYEQNPGSMKDAPEGKPPRNPYGYEPAYLPQQQGLPTIDSELKRVGLISE